MNNPEMTSLEYVMIINVMIINVTEVSVMCFFFHPGFCKKKMFVVVPARKMLSHFQCEDKNKQLYISGVHKKEKKNKLGMENLKYFNSFIYKFT